MAKLKKAENFKDPVTAAFYRHFRQLLDDKQIIWDEFVQHFGKDKQWWWSNFYNMRSGHRSVTLEQLLTAQREYKAPVGEWFKK